MISAPCKGGATGLLPTCRAVWYLTKPSVAHYAVIVQNRLNEKLDGRWIGRRGAIEWPARSPDLTPCDFFLWGYLKNKVYGQRVRDIQHLKERITHFVNELNTDKELLRRVCRSVAVRIEDCIAAKGDHFERTLHKT